MFDKPWSLSDSDDKLKFVGHSITDPLTNSSVSFMSLGSGDNALLPFAEPGAVHRLDRKEKSVGAHRSLDDCSPRPRRLAPNAWPRLWKARDLPAPKPRR